MRFEVTTRIITDADESKMLRALEIHFRKIAERVERSGNRLVVHSIEATFGSINRTDETTVILRQIDGAWLVIAEVNYRPSVAFWIILVLTFFTWVFWLVPIAFYLLHKRTVKEGIESVFSRLGNEYDRPSADESVKATTVYDDIERLARLAERGVISAEEFAAKKKQLLGL